MSSLLRGLGNWLRPLHPFSQPASIVQCLNLVRGFANQRHKKIIKLAKGTSGIISLRLSHDKLIFVLVPPVR